MKVQRIRDPLHNLIEFSGEDFEQKMWDIIQTSPFQRLRRVKQLGFSDLVYPGATHSRFAHSIGVFHTARRLAEVVKQKGSGRDVHRISIALAAALLHDVGHGPFSHAFEAVGKRLGLRFANHEEMSDILIRRAKSASFCAGWAAGLLMMWRIWSKGRALRQSTTRLFQASSTQTGSITCSGTD